MFKRISCICAVLISVLSASSAYAEGFDVRQFYSIAGSEGVFSVESARTPEHLDYNIQLMGDYANTPLRFHAGNSEARMDDLLSMTLSGAVGVLDVLEVGLTLPFVVYQTYNSAYKSVPADVVHRAETGVIGDMQLRVKGSFFKDLSGFSLGAGVIFSMPTGEELALVGDPTFWGRPYLAMTYEAGPVELMVNAGFTFRRQSDYLNTGDGWKENGDGWDHDDPSTGPAAHAESLGYRSSHGFNYGFGVNYHAIEDWLDIKGEIYGETPMSEKAREKNHQAAEFLLGAKLLTPVGVDVTFGAGAGIGSGVKNSKYRIVFGVGYHPANKDTDEDGIYDRNDFCVTVPGVEEFEGCPVPDTDADGWCDTWITDEETAAHFACRMTDKCPEYAGNDEFEGCTNPDTDADGVCDAWVTSGTKVNLEYTCTGADYCNDIPGVAEFEGCPVPDTDNDGWCDAWITDEAVAEKFNCRMTDMCPELAGIEEYRGCPNADEDADGICAPFVEKSGLYDMYFCSGTDKCPDVSEDFDDFEDEDGCPDPDNDHDGICDPWVSEMGMLETYKTVCRGVDKCPNEPETINGIKDDDGCPDRGRQIVFVREDKIEIKDKIYFANDKATIKKKSNSLLNQLAQTIQANPDIVRLSVEGHTDDTGRYEHNMTLSRQRAEAVVTALVERGVAADKLTAVGYGPDRPLDLAKTRKARALNRRVEFVITERKQ